MNQQVIELYQQGFTKSEISRQSGIPRTTVRRIIARFKGGVETVSEDMSQKVSEVDILKDKVRILQATINSSAKESLTEHYIREKILGLTSHTPEHPLWLVEYNADKNWQAVPTIFVSDTHWGEVVDANQIGGVNSYDLETAHERLQALVETSFKLLDMVDGIYPGIVVALGGDMLSGDIHEELSETNEAPMMPVFLDLFEKCIWMLKQYADKFGKVFVPCVTGNHSRTTHKIRNKHRNYTNFDWLLYVMLQKHFEDDSRIQFQIPEGPDALFQIYGTRYLLTHGCQFRGGDGMIGALGPIIRGDHKKRSRNNQIQMGYDVLLMGHWHQLIQMQRLIVNGSLKGYDEYAYSNNFGYEPPRQALWLTHPEHGIIMSMPVNVDREHEGVIANDTWVSWKS